MNNITIICKTFIKEQFKEPIQIFWIMLSPCFLFYYFAYNQKLFLEEYISVSSWFYSYISSSVALMGFSFYIIGRRESGFVRSFIYTDRSKRKFFASQFISYLIISIIYFLSFFVITSISFENVSSADFIYLLARYIVCFTLFSCIGAFFSIIPVNFQNANTIISIFIFSMIGLHFISDVTNNSALILINNFNPFNHAINIMNSDTNLLLLYVSTIFPSLIASLFFSSKKMIVNPVWSRY